jgi:hypothetical protein
MDSDRDELEKELRRIDALPRRLFYPTGVLATTHVPTDRSTRALPPQSLQQKQEQQQALQTIVAPNDPIWTQVARNEEAEQLAAARKAADEAELKALNELKEKRKQARKVYDTVAKDILEYRVQKAPSMGPWLYKEGQDNPWIVDLIRNFEQGQPQGIVPQMAKDQDSKEEPKSLDMDVNVDVNKDVELGQLTLEKKANELRKRGIVFLYSIRQMLPPTFVLPSKL